MDTACVSAANTSLVVVVRGGQALCECMSMLYLMYMYSGCAHAEISHSFSVFSLSMVVTKIRWGSLLPLAWSACSSTPPCMLLDMHACIYPPPGPSFPCVIRKTWSPAFWKLAPGICCLPLPANGDIHVLYVHMYSSTLVSSVKQHHGCISFALASWNFKWM